MVALALYTTKELVDTCIGPRSLLVYTVYGGGTGSCLGCLLRVRTSQQRSLSRTTEFARPLLA